MEMNYTPFDVIAFKKGIEVIRPPHKSFSFNAVFLALIVITLAIVAILLFILIQKKLQELAYLPNFA